MWQKVKEKFTGSTDVVTQVFDRALKETGAALDSEAAAKLKEATRAAIETARKVSLYLTDLNGDGKFDSEDVKLATEKAGLAWDKIDPDLKTAMLAGGAAGIGVNFIPFVGQAVAVPAFVMTTAYFYVTIRRGPRAGGLSGWLGGFGFTGPRSPILRELIEAFSNSV
ncbi:MAG: hypothetical protein ACK4TJ_13860, partial [Tabrizicola sp.]